MSQNDKKLRRSSSNKVVAGVLAGLAEFFGLDFTLVRVVFALVSLFTIAYGGLVIYVILWIVMPPEDSPNFQQQN